MAEKKQHCRTVTLNEAQKLFVIPTGDGGYSCLGFEVCFKMVRQLSRVLSQPDPDIGQMGTLAQYSQYRDLVTKYGACTCSNNTWFDPGTPDNVQTVLDMARVKGLRLRIWLGDIKTGISWLDEHDVVGYIGRSMGPLRSPILLSDKSADGGGCILTGCIIRIMDTKSRKELYAHSTFQIPDFDLEKDGANDFPFSVYSSGQIIARFETDNKRQCWIEFMKGERFAV